MILAFSRVTPWYVDRKPQKTNTAKPQLFYGTPKETQKDIRQGAMETRAHLRSENSQQKTSFFGRILSAEFFDKKYSSNL